MIYSCRSATRVYAAVSPKARATLRHPGTWAALAIGAAADRAQPALERPASVRDLRAHARKRQLERPLPEYSRPARLPRHADRHRRPGALCGLRARCRSAESAGVEGEPRRLLLAMSLPVFAADRRAGADLQGKRQLGGDRISGRGGAGGGGHGCRSMAARHDLHAWRSRPSLCSASPSPARSPACSPRARSAASSARWSAGAILPPRCAASPTANDLKTVVFVGRGLTASMIYELRDSGLDIRAYVGEPQRAGDHFEMTRPWSPADQARSCWSLPGRRRRRPPFAARATLVEQFKTEIFITRKSGLDGLGLPGRLIGRLAVLYRCCRNAHSRSG